MASPAPQSSAWPQLYAQYLPSLSAPGAISKTVGKTLPRAPRNRQVVFHLPSFTCPVQESRLTQPVFRFAPSPHGWLHLGHARSALTGFECARAVGGRFLVRLEDRDALRCKPEFVDQIFADLTWLGIAWETPVLRQSEHLSVYRRAAATLTAMGLTYPCFASRTDIAAAAEPGRFDPDGAPFYLCLHRQLDINDIARRIH